MKGLLIHRGKANLPEIYAYKKFFADLSISMIDIHIDNLKDYDLRYYDFIWIFMGVDTIKDKNIYRIHDYRSLSTPPFPRIKNFLKKIINKEPNLRVFLNEAVKDKFSFKDKVPFTLIDMGIDEIFFQDYSNIKKKFKFGYVGEITKNRGMDKFLDNFLTSSFRNEEILLVGKCEHSIYKKFSKYGNITFTGKVSYTEVPELLAKAEYGINYIPYKYPYIFQTSTKLYEYCAMGIKIITISTPVIRKFINENNASFFILDENFKNFCMPEIENFNYITPSMEEYSWENVIEKSGIVNILKKHLQ